MRTLPIDSSKRVENVGLKEVQPPWYEPQSILQTGWLACWGRLDGKGRILVTAERIMLCADPLAQSAIADGRTICLRRMRLEPTDCAALPAFERLLDVSGDEVKTLCLVQPDEEGHMILRSCEITVDAGMRLFALTVHWANAEFRPHWPEFSSLLGLTPSEDRIVRSLLCGLTADKIAEEQGISIDTVRTHIHHAYDKLEVSSREELWRRLASYRLD